VDRGVETFVLEIGRRLSSDFDITVFCRDMPHYGKLRVNKIKHGIANPKSSKGILGKFYLDKQSVKVLIFTLFALASLMKGKYDLIVPVNGGWQIAIIRLYTRLSGKKMLITGHAGIGSDDAWNLLWQPDIFVALTYAQAQWAKRLSHDIKVVQIPNGVDLHKFNPKVLPAKIPLPKPIIICASALVPYKRVDLTIRAIAMAKNLSLLVIGDGEQKGQIDSLAKRLLGKRYLRLVIPYSQMPGYYKAAKLFTLASQTEAFGIAYVEAMACNLPVVTTKDKSRQEIVGEAGVLVNTKNLNRYSKALSFVARSDFKNKPYAQGLKFSWNKVGTSYKTTINQLLK
jgi:glycosyltransferase involved in cell wall biosynthesis